MGEASGKRSSGKKDANLYPGTDPPCSKVSRPRGRTVDFREVQSLGYCVADRKQPHRFHRSRFLRGPRSGSQGRQIHEKEYATDVVGFLLQSSCAMRHVFEQQLSDEMKLPRCFPMKSDMCFPSTEEFSPPA